MGTILQKQQTTFQKIQHPAVLAKNRQDLKEKIGTNLKMKLEEPIKIKVNIVKKKRKKRGLEKVKQRPKVQKMVHLVRNINEDRNFNKLKKELLITFEVI